MDKAPKLINSH